MTGEILFLAHRVPYPPNRGDKIRSWNVLKALTALAPVHVAALADYPDDLAHEAFLGTVAATVQLVPHRTRKVEAMAQALMSGGSASVAACHSEALAGHVAALLAERPVSAIYAFSGQMAQYVPEADRHRFIMDFVDMDSAKFAAWGKAGGLGGFANRFEARRLFAHELAVARRADAALFVSEDEARLFRDATGLDAAKVRVLENGIDLARYHPGHPAAPLDGAGPHLIFTGQMDYAPNVEAVAMFANEAFPAIRATHADARFWIVGRAPTPAVQALGRLPGVYVTGEVADTRDWIAAADLVVAPLLLARGIQNKVLEAMAMGKAVLATPAAAEGIDVQPGQELIVTDGAAALADAALALLADAQARAKLGKAARARMEARYGWQAVLAPLAELLGSKPAQRVAA